MSFLTSPHNSLSDKFKRVVQAPFRSSSLGRDLMNDLEYGQDSSSSTRRGGSSFTRKDGAGAPENIPASARTSMSMDAVDPVPQTCWNIKNPNFVNMPATEDAAWNEGDNLVEKHDSTECQVLREIIDTLLVFAGLFSGVATAFIIESYRWLLEEPDDMSAEYLRQILAVLSNSTIPAIPQASGRPSLPNDVVNLINGLWFTSLTLSLSSALIGIVSKQWLREYLRDAGRSHITNLSVRQVKYQGLTRWWVRVIINLIPLLLQGALFIFLAGIVYLLWHIQRKIAGAVGALTLLMVVFFAATTILPTIQFMLGWAGYLRLHATNQFPYKSAQAWLFLRLTTRIFNFMAWVHYYFISMKGFQYGSSFEAPFPRFHAWPQLDLAWTRLRDESARQHNEPTSVGLCVGFMELNFEHRRLRDWIWGCLWSLRDNAANAKYVLQCVRRTPTVKSDFPSPDDNLANEVLPLLHPRLVPEATSELVMLSLLGSGKGPYAEARIEHIIRLYNSLVYHDMEEIPTIVYDTLQGTLEDLPNGILGVETRCQLLNVAQSILRRSQHTENLYGSPFLHFITTIATCLSHNERPEAFGSTESDRDLSLDLGDDITDWLERYPDPSSNWEDYKSRVVWSAHMAPIESDNLPTSHRCFTALYKLTQLVFEKARSIPADVLPTWEPDNSDMAEFARVKVAIEEAAVIPARDGTAGHGVHWDDERARSARPATAEISSRLEGENATDPSSVADASGHASMSLDDKLTGRIASARASLHSQDGAAHDDTVLHSSEGAVREEVH
ncbi:hypothetical protein K523DRAFT_367617 [Schizophyllum commune Tattone D]|nr:hypothetical protein K523DRAFT_367617 [Schizophyllum commune Tattone D]